MSECERCEAGRAASVCPECFDATVYVPGQYHCAICDFSQTQRIVNASTGQIGAKIDPLPQICPNGCGMMDRVTWKQWSEGHAKGTDRMLAWKDTLDVALQELVGAVESVLGTPSKMPRAADVHRKLEAAKKVMRMTRPDSLVRIVYEYWQHLFDGADPKSLTVVEKE